MPTAGIPQANINKRMNSSFFIIVSFLVDWWLTKIMLFGKITKKIFSL